MVPQRIRLLALLAVVGVAAACDASKQTATKSILAPRADGVATGGYTFMTTDVSSEQTKSAVIDARGGFIRFQGSALIVPENAVSAPTTFTMRLYTQPHMGAELTAVTLDGEPVTVFPVPLTLTLSYARAKNQIPDPSKVVVVWVENGVIMGTVPSVPDVQGKKVTAQLTHFSEYQPSVPGDLTNPAESPFPGMLP